jgi:ribonuclease HI
MLPKIIPKIKNQSQNYKIFPEINFKLQFDGCSKSNPGLAGAGAVIYNDGNEIWADYFFVGEKATNNHAEYAGLILGLQQAVKMNIKSIVVEGDSMLIINQMQGKYKCNSSNLIELYEEAIKLTKNFEDIYFKHIYRNENKRADQLSNIAVDKYLQSMAFK